MAADRLYAAALVGAVITPTSQIARWLDKPSGPPPVDLLLMAAALHAAALRLEDIANETELVVRRD